MSLQGLPASEGAAAGPAQLTVELVAGLLAVVLLLLVSVRAERWLERDPAERDGEGSARRDEGERRRWWTSYGPLVLVLVLFAAEVGLLVRVADWT